MKLKLKLLGPGLFSIVSSSLEKVTLISLPMFHNLSASRGLFLNQSNFLQFIISSSDIKLIKEWVANLNSLHYKEVDVVVVSGSELSTLVSL